MVARPGFIWIDGRMSSWRRAMAFIEGVFAGARLVVESIGSEEAEVIVLDTA